MNTEKLLARALDFDFLSVEEGVHLFEKAPTTELALVANELKKKKKLEGRKKNFVLLAVNIDQDMKDFETYNQLVALAIPKEPASGRPPSGRAAWSRSGAQLGILLTAGRAATLEVRTTLAPDLRRPAD